MAYNYDLRKLYEKRLEDYADDISPDGRISNVVPSTWGKGEDPAWVGSYVAIVWRHYQTYGDIRILKRHYDNLKLYMQTLVTEGSKSELPPLLTTPRKALGDWVSPDGTNIPPEGALIYYNLYYYRYLRMMADMAEVLTRETDAAYYHSLSETLRDRFNEYFYDEVDGCYYSTNRDVGYRQAPQAIALAFGLVPDDRKAIVVKHLIDDIEKRGGHYWTGILGAEAIADALCENGEVETAYRIHLKEDWPSLGNMISEGATTLWEAYSSSTTRSYNHKMYAMPLGWMARYVAGLHVDGIRGDAAGFRNAVIKPYISPSLMSYVNFHYDSPMGRYKIGWRLKRDGIEYNLVIPPDASSRVYLSLLGKKLVSVQESDHEIWRER